VSLGFGQAITTGRHQVEVAPTDNLGARRDDHPFIDLQALVEKSADGRCFMSRSQERRPMM
jgi:hypothetical protein